MQRKYAHVLAKRWGYRFVKSAVLISGVSVAAIILIRFLIPSFGHLKSLFGY